VAALKYMATRLQVLLVDAAPHHGAPKVTGRSQFRDCRKNDYRTLDTLPDQTRRLVRRKAVLGLCYNRNSCSASQAPSSMHVKSAHHQQKSRSLRGIWPPTPLIFARAICATHAQPPSAQNIGFCVIWVYTSSSSSSPKDTTVAW
jgi:hypothetical protein